MRAATEEACFIAGAAGSITLPAPMHCPDRLLLSTGGANHLAPLPPQLSTQAFQYTILTFIVPRRAHGEH